MLETGEVGFCVTDKGCEMAAVSVPRGGRGCWPERLKGWGQWGCVCGDGAGGRRSWRGPSDLRKLQMLGEGPGGGECPGQRPRGVSVTKWELVSGHLWGRCRDAGNLQHAGVPIPSQTPGVTPAPHP